MADGRRFDLAASRCTVLRLMSMPISAGAARNRFARIALGPEPSDLELERSRLAVDAAWWILGGQLHSQLLLECEPS
jgi:hypothetical protein